MTGRGFFLLYLGALLLFSALSVGSAAVFTAACIVLTSLAFSLVSALWAAATCRLTQELPAASALRGLPCAFRLTVRMACPLPVAPLTLRVTLPSGRQSDYVLPVRSLGVTGSENAFACPHVGVFPVGVTQARIGDCFGLFSFRRRVREPLTPLTVLPNPAESTLPVFSPGEGEGTLWQRALAEQTTPSDTRAWQQGDELKRVHWKLSMRKQALTVRTYETPQLADALILLDFSAPETSEALRAAAVDALTEGCAGVVRLLLEAGHPTRLPLPGKGDRELSGERAQAFSGFQTALACASYDRASDFARVLYRAARRVRRPGAIVVLTSRLTPAITDAAIALRRTGPRLRFMLYTPSILSAGQAKLLRLLAASDVETVHTALTSAGREG